MLTAFSQNERSLELYYIEHSRTTPNTKLCSEISDVFNSAVVESNRTVFLYLANGDSPLVLECKQSNREALDRMTSEILSRSAHQVDPVHDVEWIVNFFNEHDFISDGGNKNYDFVNLRFYINPSFWINGYQETVISRVAFILDLQSLPQDYFLLDIMHPSEDEFKYEVKGMFGDRSLCKDLNYVLTY